MLRSLRELIVIHGSKQAAQIQFERLCIYLVKSEYPLANTVRIQQGDGGIDIYVGHWNDPQGILVFQVKFFPDGIEKSQKQQIQKSFNTAQTNPNFKLKQWILCLPINFSQKEIIWWEEWKEKSCATGVKIDRWLDIDIQKRLFKPENSGLRDAVFGVSSPLPDRSIQFFKENLKLITKKEIENKQRLIALGGLIVLIILVAIRLITGSWISTILLKNPWLPGSFLGLLGGLVYYNILLWWKLLIGIQNRELSRWAKKTIK